MTENRTLRGVTASLIVLLTWSARTVHRVLEQECYTPAVRTINKIIDHLWSIIEAILPAINAMHGLMISYINNDGH